MAIPTLKSRTIHKYRIVPGTFYLPLPPEAKLLHLATQRDNPCMWWELPYEEPLTPPITDVPSRTFISYGTGDIIRGNKLVHLGSWLMAADSLVWHLYELLP